jgi:LytR cell envelope-related transcriptional attenuator
MRPRSADTERGIALPPWVIGVSIGIVVVAMLTFVITGGPDRGGEAAANQATEASSTSSDEPSSEPSEPAAAGPLQAPSSKPKQPKLHPKEPAKAEKPRKVAAERTVHDRSAYVEVYNNSIVTGLANETAAELQDAGWNVVGVDNWYGDIPDSTVYYPSRLHDVARLLAADLGITRLHSAVAPMRFDRLTVILTGPL